MADRKEVKIYTDPNLHPTYTFFVIESDDCYASGATFLEAMTEFESIVDSKE